MPREGREFKLSSALRALGLMIGPGLALCVVAFAVISYAQNFPTLVVLTALFIVSKISLLNGNAATTIDDVPLDKLLLA